MSKAKGWNRESSGFERERGLALRFGLLVPSPEWLRLVPSLNNGSYMVASSKFHNSSPVETQPSFTFPHIDLYPITLGPDSKSQNSTSLAWDLPGDRSRAKKRVLVSDRVRGHVTLGRIVQATTEVSVDNRRISEAASVIYFLSSHARNELPTYPTSFESRLVTGAVTLLKTLL